MISAQCASVSLALLGSFVRPTLMTAILTPAKMEDHAAMELILLPVTVLMVLLERSVMVCVCV